MTGGSVMGAPAGESGVARAIPCVLSCGFQLEIPRETPTRSDEGRSGLLPAYSSSHPARKKNGDTPENDGMCRGEGLGDRRQGAATLHSRGAPLRSETK